MKNPDNVQRPFLADDLVKGMVKMEVPNGHIEAGPRSRLFSSSIDTPAPKNPRPDHFPGSWTLK